MAFLETHNSHRPERFSLLLLDPGEIYFQDFSAILYSLEEGDTEEETVKKQQKGRLKICSKSVVFDPKDCKFPILKARYASAVSFQRQLSLQISFRDVTTIQKWDESLYSRMEHQSQMVELQCNQVVKMKENNVVAPYVFSREKMHYLFGMVYCTTDDCLPLMCQLQRASTLDIGDQTAMINAIVLANQNRVKFDTSWLDDLYEKIVIEVQGDQIRPLVTNPGRIMLTSSRLYFQPFNNIEPLPVLKIKLSDITRIIRRRFLLKHMGLEIFSKKGSNSPHIYLSLRSQEIRDDLYYHLVGQPAVQLEDCDPENMTLRWQDGVISNFDYLMYLNSLADRSTNDLTQYPVFPWVIADYSSETLDFTKPETFRDLSKPVGALNRERLLKLLARYNDMQEPKFLYGSHYSTPGYVLYYLARIAPEYVLCLQNGRFDQPDRMFNSVGETWKNCLTSLSDFKELIPEFYQSNEDFLQNKQQINFGVRQNGSSVNNVDLPSWAADTKDFVAKMSEALESDYVSQNIHLWIDLIFGYKQTEEEAENCYNVFYHLTYEGAVDIETIEDLNERAALETQIMEFGQTPKQLFTRPHPQRTAGKARSPTEALLIHSPLVDELDEGPGGCPPASQEEAIAELCAFSSDGTSSFWSHREGLKDLQLVMSHSLHKDTVTDITWSGDGENILSVAQDGFLKVYSTTEQRQLRSVIISPMPLSSCVVLPDEKTVIAGSWDNNIYFYSLEYGRMLESVYAHDDAVSHVCYSPVATRRDDHNLLVSASWDSIVKLWDFDLTRNQKVDIDIRGEFEHDLGVSCICLSNDASLVATGTKEGQISLWNVKSQQPVFQQQGHLGAVNFVAFSPDDRRLVSCGDDSYGCLRVVDVRSKMEIFSKNCGQELKCMVWDGDVVIVGDSEGYISLWDLLAVKQRDTFQAHQGAVTCMSLSENGKLASGGEDRCVNTWASDLRS